MTRRAAGLPALAAAILFALPADAAVPTLPFAEVRAGQRGVGRTVFAGHDVAEFEAEILGKLEKVGPGRNLILARLSGGPLEHTGVLAGMSGSPVYVDGKLVGAVAFTWGFAKEPIAGITPIEEMRADASRALRGTRLESASRLPLGSAALAVLDPLPAARRLTLAGSHVEIEGGAPLPTLFAASGFTPEALGALRRVLPSGAALTPGGAAAADDATAGSGTLQPGDAVGVRLVDGDLDLTAVGTVTEVSDGRLLAFGHPLLGLGEVDLPMTRARVETLFPSLSYSTKVASSGPQVGAFRSDLSSGVSGREGARPRMVPVRVELPSRAGASRTWTYRVASDPLLTPPLLFVTLASIAGDARPGRGASTFRLQPGSTLLLEDGRQVDLPFFVSGDDAGMIVSAVVAIVAQVLLQNEHEPATLAGVNLILEERPGRLEASILDIIPERSRVRPGETLAVAVHLQPHRGERLVETLEVEIPADLPPGPLTLLAGNALRLAERESEAGAALRPRSLDALLRILNNLRSFERLYLVGLRREVTAVIGAEPMPHLPPSRALALLPLHDEQGTGLLRERWLLEESVALGLAPRGLERATVQVLPARGEP